MVWSQTVGKSKPNVVVLAVFDSAKASITITTFLSQIISLDSSKSKSGIRFFPPGGSKPI